jgi:membrane protein YqaA with SNARE-associated domain
MKKYRDPVSGLASLLGSMVHWTLRFLIFKFCEKIGIEIHPKVEWFIAYVFTGIILIWLGVWSYFKWWGILF